MAAAVQPHAAALQLQLAASAPRPAASPALARRAALAKSSLAAAACVLLLSRAPPPALAYGGSGNIRSTDAGSGNARYDELVAALKERGAAPSEVAPPPAEAQKRGSCRSGREAACK